MEESEKILILDIEEIHKRKYKTLGHLLSCLRKVYTKKVPTQAVGFDEETETWTLYVNPDDYLGQKTKDHRLCCVIHEVVHILLNHPPRGKALLAKIGEKETPEAFKLLNIAADCLVNAIVEEICGYNYTDMFPNDCTYKNVGIERRKDDTLESLYIRLKEDQKGKKKQQQQGKPGDGDGEGESKPGPGQPQAPKNHEQWLKGGEGKSKKGKDQLNELADHKLRELIENTKTETQDFGDLPAAVRGIITKALAAKISIERELLIEGHGTIKATKRPTRKKPHRRLGYPFKGRKARHMGKIFVAGDASGSVSTTYKQKFLDIINKMSKQLDVEYVTFDTQIVQHIPKWNQAAVGMKDTGGGTDVQCVFDMIKARKGDRKPDKVFILTDGYFSDVNTYGYKTVFVLTPGGNKRHEGKNIHFE